jgi:hypothetical protein
MRKWENGKMGKWENGKSCPRQARGPRSIFNYESFPSFNTSTIRH